MRVLFDEALVIFGLLLLLVVATTLGLFLFAGAKVARIVGGVVPVLSPGDEVWSEKGLVNVSELKRFLGMISNGP